MENLIDTLRKKQIGNGHYRITIEMPDGTIMSKVTTNTLAIDAAFDSCYNDTDNSGRYYLTREEAQMELVNEILETNQEYY